MAPISLSLSPSMPKAASYMPVPFSPYSDDEAALSNTILQPHYAESIVSDTPTSPASIESFDILDSIAWRRGYTSYETHEGRSRAYEVLRKRGRKNRAQIIATLLLFTLFIAGCAIGGWAVVQHQGTQAREACLAREGGERCNDPAWAKCVAINGAGYCLGVM
ncbi:hypothetical protein PMIN06_001497 [Paraphaeosphaeria minitans]